MAAFLHRCELYTSSNKRLLDAEHQSSGSLTGVQASRRGVNIVCRKRDVDRYSCQRGCFAPIAISLLNRLRLQLWHYRLKFWKKKKCIYSIFISGLFRVFNVALYISLHTNNRMFIFYACHTSVHRRPHHYKDGQNASSIKLNQNILIAPWPLDAV